MIANIHLGAKSRKKKQKFFKIKQYLCCLLS